MMKRNSSKTLIRTKNVVSREIAGMVQGASLHTLTKTAFAASVINGDMYRTSASRNPLEIGKSPCLRE